MPATQRKHRNTFLPSEEVEKIVRQQGCPTCGSKQGIPCRNAHAGFEVEFGGPKAKRARKQFYAHYVHEARKRRLTSPAEPAVRAKSRLEAAKVVRQRACPLCKAPKGSPCRNTLAAMQGFDAPYNYYVHAARRRA